MKDNLKTLVLITLTIFFTLEKTALTCTGMQLKAKDGSVVNGRTDEFGIKMGLSGIFIPRNFALSSTKPDGTAGYSYKTKYAAIGAGTFGDTNIVDGINEKGLVVAAFYFPGFASYAKSDSNKNQLSPTEFATWALTQFANIDELKKNINSVVIVGSKPKGWPVIPPFHYVAYDKQGNSITIEPIDEKIKVFDNQLGVITNSPTFDWHLTNLRNYISLSPINIDSVKLLGLELNQIGQGNGLHGLPGDFTPPSRFIRASIFEATALPSDNAEQAVMQLFHILNQFDIPLGSVRNSTDKNSYEQTLATVVRDAQNLKYYYKTYDDQNIKVIDLKKFDFNSKKMLTMPIKGQTAVEDVSEKLK